MNSRIRSLVLAFSIAGFLGGCSTVAYVPQAPPAPKTEVRPAKPGPGHVWVNGHWNWNGHRYVWVSGHWSKNRGGKQWVAGHWTKTPRGHVWASGHWK